MSLRPVPVGAVIDALAGAGSVALSAYVLPRGSPLVGALEAAAAHGAAVRVRLPAARPGTTPPSVGRVNAGTVADLRAHGVDARLDDGVAFVRHLKAAAVDGRAFLDDRNWTRDDVVLATDDPADVACVRAAVDGVAGTSTDLATDKRRAVAAEARAIVAAGPGDEIDVASESFGPSAVSKALMERAAAGNCVHVVVSDRVLRSAGKAERAALGRLIERGVDVRAGPQTDKVCVAGTRAWLGSANATDSPPPDVLDWGVETSDPKLVILAERTFAAAWEHARPLTARDLATLSG